jgi:hypothetical protein
MDAARSYWPIGHDDLGSYHKIEKAARHLGYRLFSVTASPMPRVAMSIRTAPRSGNVTSKHPPVCM